jgi:hypothetical protein
MDDVIWQSDAEKKFFGFLSKLKRVIGLFFVKSVYSASKF